ncbi:MAG: Ku protein [Alphaproteobacteria bacterium]
MALRAYWKGYLRLSLVTIGVELYSAVSGGSSPSFHQIHKPSGKRIRYQKVAPGIGPVDREEIVKGYEIDKDEYVLVEPDELDEIKLESKRTIELVQFVDDCEIDPQFFDRPYYMVPAEDEVAPEGFAVIREALRDSGKVGLGQMAVRGRDYVVAIKPCGKGLLLETLRYADEVRQSDRVFSDIPDVDVERDMLNLAEELIERKKAPFRPEAFRSQYVKALRELIDEKRKTGKVTAAAEEEIARGGKVIDLMEALKKSVAGDKGAEPSAKKKAAKRKPARRKAG